LLPEPRIIFLDDPTAALDPEASHLVREFIEELRKQGRTIFLCTHSLDEADRLCDRIGVFKSHLLVVARRDLPWQTNLKRRNCWEKSWMILDTWMVS
jgi:ABC-type multidrug transport system ATPase subunit